MGTMTDSAALAAIDEAIRITDRKTDWMDNLKAAREHIAARLREPAGVGSITDEEIAGWEAERGNGMESAVGEYTPAEFWRVLDELKRLRAPRPPAEARECKCNMRTKLVGDGCDVCNPEYAAQLADDPAEAQAQGGGEVVAHGFYDPATGAYSETQRTPRWLPAVVCTAPPSAPVGVEGFDKRFAEMLLGILNDVQDALGFTDEDKLCANGSAEIVAEIRELKRVAALAQQPAAVDGAAREYLAARDAYDAATRPPNSHAQAPRLKHGDPIVLRLRAARAALDAALAAQPGGSDNDR